MVTDFTMFFLFCRMNAEKLAKLQSQVRIGGPGTARRKKKVVHRTATTDDKKLQSSLKKLTVNNIPGIEEVNMFKDDGTIIHFNNPKVQASLAANTFAITGHAEHKRKISQKLMPFPSLLISSVIVCLQPSLICCQLSSTNCQLKVWHT